VVRSLVVVVAVVVVASVVVAAVVVLVALVVFVVLVAVAVYGVKAVVGTKAEGLPKIPPHLSDTLSLAIMTPVAMAPATFNKSVLCKASSKY
jgi:4-hydroxybenzoate polyprenyltransferase